MMNDMKMLVDMPEPIRLRWIKLWKDRQSGQLGQRFSMAWEETFVTDDTRQITVTELSVSEPPGLNGVLDSLSE